MPISRRKKSFKTQRKMSRAYCKKTPCRKMGFSQKASCRPYKNCYTRSYKFNKNKDDKFMKFKEQMVEEIVLSFRHANMEDLREYAKLFTDINTIELDKMTKDQMVDSLATLLKKNALKCRGARVRNPEEKKRNKEKCQEADTKLFLGAKKREKEEFINAIQKATYEELIEFYELFTPKFKRKDIENTEKDDLVEAISSVFSMLSCQTPLPLGKTPEEKERIHIETERIKQRCKESKEKLEKYK